MSNAIMNIASAPVPAFLQKFQQGGNALNSQLAALASGFPTISIKGKVFAVVRDGVRQVLTRPDDDTAPASYIMAIIANASGVVKTYYDHAYVEGSEDMKPACFSMNGERPDPQVTNKQCDNCRLCPKNAWGTAKNESGAFTRGKACSDSVRLALVTGNDTECYLMRVPPASLKALGQYMKQLGGIPYNAVLTKISFDINAPSPQLVFQFAGYLDEAQYNRVKQMGESDQAMRIIGKDTATVAAAPSTALSGADPFGTQAMTTQAPAPQPAPAPVAPVAPAPQPAPVAPAPMPQAQAADLGQMFDGADVPW